MSKCRGDAKRSSSVFYNSNLLNTNRTLLTLSKKISDNGFLVNPTNFILSVFSNADKYIFFPIYGTVRQQDFKTIPVFVHERFKSIRPFWAVFNLLSNQEFNKPVRVGCPDRHA